RRRPGDAQGGEVGRALHRGRRRVDAARTLAFGVGHVQQLARGQLIGRAHLGGDRVLFQAGRGVLVRAARDGHGLAGGGALGAGRRGGRTGGVVGRERRRGVRVGLDRAGVRRAREARRDAGHAAAVGLVEVLGVVGGAEAGGQLQLVGDVVVHLAEDRLLV